LTETDVEPLTLTLTLVQSKVDTLIASQIEFTP